MSTTTDKAILTCSLNGVLTDPKTHPVPVTAKEMAASAKEAFDAGASIMHIHFRRQEEGQGHFPSWDPDVAAACSDAIRAACPGVIINQTTGVVGRNVDAPIACMDRIKPEIAACNAGSLNYLKLRSNDKWAWPPMLFDNNVDKVNDMLVAMKRNGSLPEFECFDVGIVRSVDLYVRNGMSDTAQYNFVMGVASGMPVDEKLLELLVGYRRQGTPWQCTLIGRQEILARPPTHRRARRHAAHRRRRHLLFAQRRAHDGQRAAHRRVGEVRGERRAKRGVTGGSASDPGLVRVGSGLVFATRVFISLVALSAGCGANMDAQVRDAAAAHLVLHRISSDRLSAALGRDLRPSSPRMYAARPSLNLTEPHIPIIHPEPVRAYEMEY